MMKLLPLLLVLFITACGFSPMYGKHSSAQNSDVRSALNQISIDVIPDREGQYLRNALMDRFYAGGIPSNPAFRLQIDKIQESVADFDITIESEATRRQLHLSTKMRLIDSQTQKILLERSLSAITSHNVLESEFSTIVTEQSAREAALNDLSRQTERQLALYFAK